MKSAFELVFSLQGYPLQRMRGKLAEIQTGRLNSVIDKDARRRAIFDFHYTQNTSYRNLVGEAVPQNWNDVPILTKPSFQTGLENWLAKGYTKNNVFLNSTSGSSGIPFKFAKDKESHALTWALIEHRYRLIGIDVFRDLEARFYGIPITPYSKYFKETLKDYIALRRRFPVFNLQDEVLENYYKRFKSSRYVYLNGYTSALVAMAEYIIKRKYPRLNEVCPSLKTCITTSEMCSEEDRKLMEKAFGVTVINEYGAAELDIVAIEDSDGDWILNEETLMIEVVDDNNKVVEDGREGKILATALFNKAMPFIRYELGDRAVISPKRKGPYRILEKLTGRTNDIAELPSGRRVPGLTFYYVTKSLLKEEGLINEIVIKQEAIDSFLVIYSGERDLNTSEKEMVKELMDAYLEPGLRLRIERVKNIIRQPSGKLKQFEKTF